MDGPAGGLAGGSVVGPGRAAPGHAAVRHPRFAPRRTRPGGTWWSRAVLRAVEEAAYSEGDLRTGRAIARGGDVGGITVLTGSALAAVEHEGDLHTVTVTVPVLDETDAATLVELVAAESGRIGALMAGDLPHTLVEAIEEAGVELLPYGGELGSECSCEGWLDPCPHALAVLTQVAWLVQDDPFVLTHLRGLPREDVLARLHALTTRAPGAPDREADPVDPALGRTSSWPRPPPCAPQPSSPSSTGADRLPPYPSMPLRPWRRVNLHAGAWKCSADAGQCVNLHADARIFMRRRR